MSQSQAKKSPNRAPKKKSANKGRPAGLFTWIAVGVVVVVVAGLVIAKVAGSSNGATSSDWTAADPAAVKAVTSIPASEYNAVGVTSPGIPVSAPAATSKQPLLTTTVNGKTLPVFMYVGAEYCPFCAAERWSVVAALSRFGTWSNLGNGVSSTKSGEVYPGTQTFTFLKAHYSSPYVAFSGVEEFTSVWNDSLGFYNKLTKPTKVQQATWKKYDTSTYIPTLQPSQNGSIPFVSVANQFLSSGASYSPAPLQGMTRATIAQGLSDPTSPVTQAIVATANYQSAAICAVDGNLPASVCNSPGVKAAKTALHLK